MPRQVVIGIDELLAKMDKIALSVQPKIVAQSLRAAMTPMLKDARANAPKGSRTHKSYKGRLLAPGFLKQNIKLKKLKRRDKTVQAYGLWAQKEGFYGGFVETGIAGESDVTPNPWLGKAYSKNAASVQSLFLTGMRKRIEKAMK